MPVDTNHWNEYLAQLIRQNHPFVKDLCKVINPKLIAYHNDDKVMQSSMLQYRLFRIGVRINLTHDYWDVVNQQRKFLDPTQKTIWDQHLKHLQQNEVVKNQLDQAINELMNDNRHRIALLNIDYYQNHYDPNKHHLLTNHDDLEQRQFLIFELLNVIENKLIKLIQTNFYNR